MPIANMLSVFDLGFDQVIHQLWAVSEAAVFFRDSIYALINLKLVYCENFPVKPLQLHW